MSWKDWPSWVKGGVIGILIALIIFIIYLSFESIEISKQEIIDILTSLGFSLVLGFFIGAIEGIFISKVINKEWNFESKGAVIGLLIGLVPSLSGFLIMLGCVGGCYGNEMNIVLALLLPAPIYLVIIGWIVGKIKSSGVNK